MKNLPSEQKDNTKLSITINRRVLRYAVAIICVAVLAYILVAQPQQLMSFISGIVSIFLPLIIGFGVAYIVNLILRPLERFWTWIWHKCSRRKFVDAIKRPLCLVLAFLIFISALVAMVFMVIPEIKDTVNSFDIKKYSISDKEWFKKTEAFLEKYYFDDEKDVTADSTDESDDKTVQTEETETGNKLTANNAIIDELVKSWSTVLNTTVSVTTAIISALVNIVLGFAIAIYLLAQKEKFKGQLGRIITAFFEPAKANRVKEIASLTNTTFTNFVTGQLAESCILGILCFIGMVIFKMPNAGIISVLVGFTALIPVFGAFVGAGIGAFLILFESPIKAIWFIIFIIVLQQIEGNIIYPRVVGKSVGLPSVWVLIAVTIGGKMFGVMGMILSVPICSVAYVLLREYVNKKNKKTSENKSLQTDETEVLQE